MPKLTAIAAVARNRVIGDGTGMLWNIPEDFARFKAITMGGAMVMGRATYESLGRPLPGRTSIVLTRDKSFGVGEPDPATPARFARSAQDDGGRGPSAQDGGASVSHGGYPSSSFCAERSGVAESAKSTTSVIVVHSVDEALRTLETIDKSWWVIGGGQIYRALWPYTTNLDLTLVHQSPAGAVTFPELGDDWVETGREPHDGFDFVQYERREV